MRSHLIKRGTRSLGFFVGSIEQDKLIARRTVKANVTQERDCNRRGLVLALAVEIGEI